MNGVLLALCLIILTAPITAKAQTVEQDPLLEFFALDGAKNIMKEENFGIINGHITCRVNYQDVGTFSGLFAPPYASSNFLVELRLFGEIVPTQRYRWYPFEVRREGAINDVEVHTSLVLLRDKRAGLLKVTLRNTTDKAVQVPVQLHIQGNLNYIQKWEFARPVSKQSTRNEVQGGQMIRSNDEGRMILSTDLPGLHWFELGSRWDTRVSLAAGAERTHYLVVEMGGPDITPGLTAETLRNPEPAIQAARTGHVEEVKHLLKTLPRFTASDKRLEKYYYRSLVVLILNKWKVPEFILQPYYGSGAVIGGCVGNYLWEFGLPAQLFPLYDPEASKEHIKQFLKIDITRHFLFDPMTGTAGGQWYQVNQDKIIELIYYYVLHTGDRSFLHEQVDGMTVYEHVMKNARFGDDPGKPVTLVDYGDEGENHLELRRGYPYRGIMPDVNALRYLSYMRAHELSKLMGRPAKDLPQRAKQVKELLKKELWSEKDKWFYFENKGKRDIRMTNFMFTLIGTGVFDKEVEDGLLSHLNEREFLSDFGIHSISKLDPAYDQVDIDHGGGGSYVAFPPLICQRFYNAGYAAAADDLLSRVLWWGERLPYWGDSKVANYMGYREDTPLQSDFDAMSGAQTFIFGLFGVQVAADGSIRIHPTLPAFSPEISLEGLQLLGKTLNIRANSQHYVVEVDGRRIQSPLNKPVIIKK